jgi:hypothetical protein
VELADLRTLFLRAKKLTGHSEFVVVGSLSALGILRGRDVPARMLMSNDVDCFTKTDPARIFELRAELGEGSAFEAENGFYLDPVSPTLPTLPDGWEKRLFRVPLEGGLVVHFLDPNDAAVSKYARGEARDREWARAGIGASLLSIPVIEHRFRETVFFDAEEATRARAALEEDKALAPGRTPKRNPKRR